MCKSCTGNRAVLLNKPEDSNPTWENNDDQWSQ